MELENFRKLHGFFIEDLRLNQTEEIEKKITEKDINEFAKLSGAQIKILSGKGHMLPLTQPEECSTFIRSMMDETST